MNPGDGDDTGGRAPRKADLSSHPARTLRALAVLVALAGVRCSGGDDDGLDVGGASGQPSPPGGASGSAGVSGSVTGGNPSAGTTQLPAGAPGTSGSAGTSGVPGGGGTGGGSGGKSSAGSGGSATAGQSGGGAPSAGNGGRGGNPTAGRGGSSGRGGAGTAGTSGGSGGSGTGWNVAGTLEAHNEVRAMVTMGEDLPALTWSSTLAAFAQEWADTLADECDGIQHRMQDQYGENIAAQWFFGATPAPSAERYGPEAVAAWAEEIECWTYGTIAGTETCDQQCIEMQNSSGCGHYTQLVWRNTQRVGCGYATCDPMQGDLMEIFVCNYDPPGNYVRQAPY